MSSSPPILDILGPIYAAITADETLMALLGEWRAGRSVHTRRPIPEDGTYPAVIVGPLVTRDNSGDGINDWRPLVIVDVTVHGQQSAQYRVVDTIAEMLHNKFHGQRESITVTDYHVVQVDCTGPTPGPEDDESYVARRVTLNVQLYAR